MEFNNTRADLLDPLSVTYACVGIAAIVSNILIFVILFSDKKLLSHSAVIAGFAWSHLLLGCYIGISGFVRVIQKDILYQKISPMTCLRTVYPVTYPMAFQCSALLLCMVGTERLIAVAFPHWFRRWFSQRRMWYLLGLGFLVVLSSVAVGISLASALPPTTRQCGQPGVFGNSYTAFVRAASAAGGTVAVILTITAMIIGTRRIRRMPLLSGEAGKLKKQVQMTRAMLSVSFADFCLVVVPNTVSFVAAGTGANLPSFMGPLPSNIAFCVNATIGIVCYLTFNTQFRRAAARLFCFKGNGVVPAIPVMNESAWRPGNDKAAA